jgi:hypothetical protein
MELRGLYFPQIGGKINTGLGPTPPEGSTSSMRALSLFGAKIKRWQ